MKKDFNDAINDLMTFCNTFRSLDYKDKLLFAILGPNGSDVAATVANEVHLPKPTLEEIEDGYKSTDSIHYNPVCCAHCTIEGMSTEHLSPLDCAACKLTPDTWMSLKDGNCAMYDSEGDIFDVFIDGEHYFEKPRDPIPKDDLV